MADFTAAVALDAAAQFGLGYQYGYRRLGVSGRFGSTLLAHRRADFDKPMVRGISSGQYRFRPVSVVMVLAPLDERNRLPTVNAVTLPVA
ncbi:hypothetical protein [Pseudidiomarina sp.]|uniref:hypothetical protein n=1 Tax=Pseudidiomarina sp. TaxID=2081707 RepID=UPI00299DC350|nr:hypothetical protein [Pseudidiomarina sp.]MDX1704888.1 hypothetical protein [Pseudidiomarina sp.]